MELYTTANGGQPPRLWSLELFAPQMEVDLVFTAGTVVRQQFEMIHQRKTKFFLVFREFHHHHHPLYEDEERRDRDAVSQEKISKRKPSIRLRL